VTAWYSGKERACSGRHKSLDVYQMVEMRYGEGDVKMHRYGELLRCLLADQLAWTKDRRHVRKVTEQNGRDALAIAVEADILARTGDAKLVNS
jgi:hypothetical protein